VAVAVGAVLALELVGEERLWRLGRGSHQRSSIQLFSVQEVEERHECPQIQRAGSFWAKGEPASTWSD